MKHNFKFLLVLALLMATGLLYSIGCGGKSGGAAISSNPTITSGESQGLPDTSPVVPFIPEPSPTRPPTDCTNLEGLIFPDIEPDVHAQIFYAVHIDADETLPAHCKVTGVIELEILFEIKLPLPGNWNGKFYMGGCGGFCGSIGEGECQGCDYALTQGYATAETNTGHESEYFTSAEESLKPILDALGMGSTSMLDASWALNNPERKLNFAHRAVHLTAMTAKAIINSYFNSYPLHSYFTGWSNGGRLAMKLAQEYPTDFDGIIAGTPALNLVNTTPIVIQRILYGTGAHPLDWAQPGVDTAIREEYQYLAQKLWGLHYANSSTCDPLDGLYDGIISDPTICYLSIPSSCCYVNDVETCPCLNPKEMSIISRIYYGAPRVCPKECVPGTDLYQGVCPDPCTYCDSAYIPPPGQCASEPPQGDCSLYPQPLNCKCLNSSCHPLCDWDCAKSNDSLKYPGYSTYGCEDFTGSWKTWMLSDPESEDLNNLFFGAPNLQYKFISEIMRYFFYDDEFFNFGSYPVLYHPLENPDYLNDLDKFGLDMDDIDLVEALNATNTDLSEFKANGGKIIMWHGWCDPMIQPKLSIQYYEATEIDPVNGPEDIRNFFRLFMIPGVLHIDGGNGPGNSGPIDIGNEYGLDWLGKLEVWVENDIAPDRVVASGVYCDEDPPYECFVSRTRPLCPFPQLAVWVGPGDQMDEVNFECQGGPLP